MKISFLLSFFTLFFFTFIAAQNQPVKLPDISKVDSVRVTKRMASPSDTVRKVQFITIEQGDTIRGALQDSASLAIAIRDKIQQENSQASNNTYLLYTQFTKAKGLLEYNKVYRRVTGQNYTDFTWSTMKTPYLGQWQMSGQGITSHVLTVGEDAKAIRNTGSPKYSGTFRILAPSRFELVNYLANGTVITFDFVTRNQLSQGGQTFTQEVFMSTDGRFFMVK
jgi:hypothetical protein